MFITAAPWPAAQIMPAATSLSSPPPLGSRTRTGEILAPHATPAPPRPLLATAATIPAVCVPWPCKSSAPARRPRARTTAGADVGGQVLVPARNPGVHYSHHHASAGRRVPSGRAVDFLMV